MAAQGAAPARQPAAADGDSQPSCSLHAFTFAGPSPRAAPQLALAPAAAAPPGAGSPLAAASPQALALAATLQSAQAQRVRSVALHTAHDRVALPVALPGPLAWLPAAHPHPHTPLPQARAEHALHSLQAAKATPSPGGPAAGKENATGAAGPYSHRRVSPGHFLVHPTLQAPAQQQVRGSATPSGSGAAPVVVPLAGTPGAQPLGTPRSTTRAGISGAWGYCPPHLPAPAGAAATPQQAGQEAAAAAGASPQQLATTPMSLQGSRASSALVDNLNLALRALGAPAAGPTCISMHPGSRGPWRHWLAWVAAG